MHGRRYYWNRCGDNDVAVDDVADDDDVATDGDDDDVTDDDSLRMWLMHVKLYKEMSTMTTGTVICLLNINIIIIKNVRIIMKNLLE